MSDGILAIFGALYLIVGIAELVGYFSMNPRLLRLASRPVVMEIVPVPGLRKDDLQSFRGQTENTIYRYHAGSGALLVRRRHDSMAKRIPTWLHVTFTEDAERQLQPQARWAAMPYLTLLGFWVLGMVMIGLSIGIPIRLESLVTGAIMGALTTAMIGMVYGILFVLGRSAARMMFIEVEVQLIDLVQAREVS